MSMEERGRKDRGNKEGDKQERKGLKGKDYQGGKRKERQRR